MKPPVSEKVSLDQPLEERVFYVVGPDRLQNELIASFLKKESDGECFVFEDFSSVVFSDDSPSDNQAKLILWDCRGKDLQTILTELNLHGIRESFQGYIVLLNVMPNMGIEEHCVWNGFRGFFYERDPLDRFLKGIRAILSGELWLSREIMTKCILEGKGQEDPTDVKDKILTPRQVEILALVAIGASNDEIAEKLCISSHTVKTHLYNIFKKIKVPNRLQAALWSAKNLEHVILKYYSIDHSSTTLVPRPPARA